MTASELVKAGMLDDALKALQDEVRKSPSEPKLRVFLSQLLAVMGQWQRALQQLEASAQFDPSFLSTAQMYRTAIQCQVMRDEVITGKRQPLILGEPASWVGQMLQACHLLAQGNADAARLAIEQAFAEAPDLGGFADGKAFTALSDADMRFGPILEVIVSGRYYWCPLTHVRKLRLDKPADLRDVVWLPAKFRWVNGGHAVGLVFARYPGSESSDDGQIRLARRTDWRAVGAGLSLGVGQRMLATDMGDLPILELRELLIGEPETDEEKQAELEADASNLIGATPNLVTDANAPAAG